MKKISICLLFLLAGCAMAVDTTGPIPESDGMYTITRQGNGFWVNTSSLKAQAVKEATAYCDSKQKEMKLIHSKEIPSGVMGRWPESEILFKCEYPTL